MAGIQVVIVGTGFGAAQGSGAVWLGNAYGKVKSWSDNRIVGVAARNTRFGEIRVRQGGVWSKAVAFNVSTPRISSISPATGVPGTVVTINGSGFGALQADGQVWLDTGRGAVRSWTDTQIVAVVGRSAVAGSGRARILHNGTLSNAVPFSVSGGHLTVVETPSRRKEPASAYATAGHLAGSAGSRSDSGVTLLPNVLNLVAGSARSIQALDAAGQPVQGLTWTSGDPGVVQLSSDDPPILTAVSAGHTTISAGGASVDVTVYADALPAGTVIWSNPGNGSGLNYGLPAIPASTGVADVFAFQFDGTVQAITEDGLTAWTADVNDASAPVADFQGGIVASGWSDGSSWIRKWDGATGQPYPKYTAGSDGSLTLGAVHTDGTIFAIEQDSGSSPYTVVGIDPVTAAQKFSIPVSIPGSNTQSSVGSFIVAGDGYAYLPYAYRPWGNGWGDVQTTHLRLLRIDTTGAYDDISVADFSTLYSEMFGVAVNMITNGETGTLLSWSTWSGNNTVIGMATTNGTSVSVSSGLLMQGQTDAVVPMVQAQDGTLVGTVWAGSDDDSAQYMIAFDQSGNVLWTAPNDQPEIATADGGVIGLSGNIYDATGKVVGSIGSVPIQSWTMNQYQFGDSLQQVAGTSVLFGFGRWPFNGANQSGNSVAPIPVDSVTNAWVDGLDFSQVVGGIAPTSAGTSLRAATAHVENSNKQVDSSLGDAQWQGFARSNCATIFANVTYGIANNVYLYSLSRAQNKQHEKTNYYDVGNPVVAAASISSVTAGESKINNTLAGYLGKEATAATVNSGETRHTAVILKSGFFKIAYPRFTLLHETLIHAYGNWDDSAVFANSFFTVANGLWNDHGRSNTISEWIGADCKCTPDPSPQNPYPSCQPATAKW